VDRGHVSLNLCRQIVKAPRQRPLKSIIAGKMNRISPIFPTLYAPLSQSAMALLSVMLIFIESVGRSARALAKVS
jgi:hypothetical protein